MFLVLDLVLCPGTELDLVSCSVRSMALIEGVGDEVTLLCVLVLLLSLVVLAWISTHTTERGSGQWSPPGPGDEDPSGRRGAEHDGRQSGSGHNQPDGTLPGVTQDDGTSTGPSQSPEPESPSVRHRRAQDPPGADTITLRLKFLNETERVVNVRSTDTILHIKRGQFPGQEPRVRLIYQGQLLRDDAQTVASLQLTDGCVLHCHLAPHAAASASGGPEPAQDSVNIGSLMVPLFLLLLGLVWYQQLQHPQVFSATATACLGALTVFVLVLVFSSYRR
ncbi:transmembrane and ubiquitin-like domain-containing protein 1 [Engystomops pustulosus]|uniref:transmembrane and ubiquitin-like domain-containing protein 1 n=1 Tax=Engystomops pustulosus TaxID=76066 RepID=UPI003AFA5A65